jgi:hypothetical protein
LFTLVSLLLYQPLTPDISKNRGFFHDPDFTTSDSQTWRLGDDVAPICFVQHFVPAAGMEIVSDCGTAGAAITINQYEHAFEPLANRIVAARKDENGQVVAHFSDFPRISQARKCVDSVRPQS